MVHFVKISPPLLSNLNPRDVNVRWHTCVYCRHLVQIVYQPLQETDWLAAIDILGQQFPVPKHWTYLSKLTSLLDHLPGRCPMCTIANYKIEGWGEAAVELQLVEKMKFPGGGLNLNNHRHLEIPKLLRTKQHTLLIIVQRLETASMVVRSKHCKRRGSSDFGQSDTWVQTCSLSKRGETSPTRWHSAKR